jgi:hypothetical protein
MIVLRKSIHALPAPQSPLRPFQWWEARLVSHSLILAGVVLFSYYGMWRAYFATLDDFTITGWVRRQATWWDALQGYGSGVRFLNYLLIRFKTEFFGVDASLYLWSSLVQYLLLTWLVYGLALLLWQGHRKALLAAVLFAITYSHYEVVTYVSASDYSLWAAVYLLVLLCFAGYLHKPWLRPAKVGFYWAAVLLYLMLAFANDFTLSLPLVLAAYHLVVIRAGRSLWSLTWRDLQIHFPFWGIWAMHVGVQLQLILAGTSELVYSDNPYLPGLHMISNLRYLIFLILPNMRIAPIQNFLAAQVNGEVVASLWTLSMLFGVLIHGGLLWLCWRGSSTVRFAVALIYLPFLQYTLWQGHLIEAPRYLLLSSIGYNLLLAKGIVAFATYVYQRRAFSGALLLMLALPLYITVNVGVIQIWVQQHIENGNFRHAFVTELATRYSHISAEQEIWIEVPRPKYLDLEAACQLVYAGDVPCTAFVTGELSPTPIDPAQMHDALYWLRATERGIEQIIPSTAEAK